MTGIRGVLLDIDGTLLTGDSAIEGAPALIGRLRRAELPFRLITNTTRRPRSAIAAALGAAGFHVVEDEILVPAVMARNHIVASGRLQTALLVNPDSRVDFAGVVEDEQSPRWVVLGDLGADLTWELMNRAFLWLMQGATLVALQKNRYWHDGSRGLSIDAGPFVVALEYATGTKAELVGKPSPAFFRLALAELGLPAEEVIMVGDDLSTDCAGGAAAGCRTALVKTGKFRPGDAAGRGGAAPDAVLDSVAKLLPGP